MHSDPELLLSNILREISGSRRKTRTERGRDRERIASSRTAKTAV
jgi:hypothetical protein